MDEVLVVQRAQLIESERLVPSDRIVRVIRTIATKSYVVVDGTRRSVVPLVCVDKFCAKAVACG